MNFVQKVIVIPEKLTTLAATGILYLVVQFLIWFSNVTGIDFTTIGGEVIAAAIAGVLTMVVKLVLEKVVPERFHIYVNSFLAWLASIVGAHFLYQALR